MAAAQNIPPRVMEGSMQSTFPKTADDLQRMSPDEWTALKGRVVRNARIARNAAIRQAFSRIFESLLNASRAISELTKTSRARIGTRRSDHA
jgi:hypothetical protein